MKLYELHRGEMFRLIEQPVMPPDYPIDIDMNKLFILHHTDGMYCAASDTEKNMYYFAAWTEVEPCT